MNLDFTFLKEDQIWGDDALDVIKRYGTKVAPTDLTVILGGYMGVGIDDDGRTSENDVTCESWSASSNVYQPVRCVSFFGSKRADGTSTRGISARPALSKEEASKISLKNIHKGINDVQIGEFGEYPQTVASKDISETLELLYQSKSQKLRPTGKKYTFDLVDLRDYDIPFKATVYPEYEMDGKRYIRVPGRPANENSMLSTREQVENGKPYWVEVQPIEWLMDDRNGTMVAKKCLFAGIQFDTQKKYDGDFSKTSMKHYLDTFFANEMLPLERTDIRENTSEKTDYAATKKLKNLEMEMLRTIAAGNISAKKGVVYPKRSDAVKQVIKAALDSTMKGIGK